MFVNRLMSRSATVLSKLYTHPFNQQLSNGTLPRETFKFYLVKCFFEDIGYHFESFH